MPTFKELTDYFNRVGATDVGHSSKTYLAHAIGVYNDLKAWGEDEEIARVGLFHSIYGTELFQGFTLPLDRRDEVRELIGARAELISWLNCVMDRGHFDREIQKPTGPYEIRDRITGETVPTSDEDFTKLCLVHLCDWLEQVERSENWDYRREAYKNLAKRVGGIGQERHEAVFANAPVNEYDSAKVIGGSS